jgi:phosphoribosylpyrophosphate synthetase
MKVRFLCGYYSDLAHNKQRRPEDYWDAYFFCWAVKKGKFKRAFNIHDATGKTPINAKNFDVVRGSFGNWIEKSVESLGGGDDVVLVPVPSKDGVSGAKTFRSFEMTNEALKNKKLAAQVVGGLRWNEELTKAHEGGTRDRALLASQLNVDAALIGKKVILVDDLMTKGSSLLAATDVLEQAGATVLGAVVCGKTMYDLNTRHFGEQEFDLAAELADWNGGAESASAAITSS